ncbi:MULTISPECIES: hypothetical protein [Micrococcaceae]|uniref:Nucleotide exchange factor GrpE n=1 Tax=Glutamicibacter ectropisis TaxID=3046593 RepID=A0AAU6WCZ4_9MICC|nr:hypothetical protein [Arthrobacter sp. NIO-1057]SCC28376.1 hypothetical protein GA0061084_1972 [Arthrobacter sp. NIO-1057]
MAERDDAEPEDREQRQEQEVRRGKINDAADPPTDEDEDRFDAG